MSEMPTWVTIVVALGTLILGGGGALAWIKYFHSDAPTASAGVVSTLADAKLKDAQATETIATAFTQTLASVRQLAEERATENRALRDDLNVAEQRIDKLDDRLDALEHHYSPRGTHGAWDIDALAAARMTDPEHPGPPDPPQES